MFGGKINFLNMKKAALTTENNNSYLYQILLMVSGILFVFVWISFIFTPLTNDIKVFMASANQAGYISDNLIVGSFKSWELKSVFSRMLMYLIYKISCTFVAYNSVAFEALSKFIYSCFVIIGCYGSMKLIFVQKKVMLRTFILIISFMALHTGCQMQVEMTCSLLILLAFSLYLNAIQTEKNCKLKLVTSGILIGSTFFFKSVLILMSVTVVAAVCIYIIHNKTEFSIKRLMIVVSGSLITLLVTSIAIIFINPAEFQDMLDASKFQNTLLSVSISKRELFFRFKDHHESSIKFIPVVVIGIGCFMVNLWQNVCSKKWNLIFFHFVMWLMPALFIMLSNQYFIYHFAAYIFPSLIEIYYVITYRNRFSTVLLSVSVAAAIIWYTGVFSIISTNVRTYMEYNEKAYKATEDLLHLIDYDRSETVLYLDDGCGGYCLGGPSYLKYFFPLPLQRLEEDSQLESHVCSLEMAMKFTGKYISVYEDWFFKEGNYQMLKDKIRDAYQYAGSYYAFVPPHSVDISDIVIKKYDLYERK